MNIAKDIFQIIVIYGGLLLLLVTVIVMTVKWVSFLIGILW